MADKLFIRALKEKFEEAPDEKSTSFYKFGGWKQSLYGDHHMHGMEGVRFYTKLKTITGRWPTGSRQGVEFNIPTVK